jgi:hypothetical protein
MLQTELDHNIISGPYDIPDFSVSVSFASILRLSPAPFLSTIFDSLYEQPPIKQSNSRALLISLLQRAGISFPFVDRLSDKSTPFTYGNQILISASNVLAVEGAAAYGNTITNATFDPPCDAYAHAIDGATYFNAYPIDHPHGIPAIGTLFAPLRGRDESPYSLDL